MSGKATLKQKEARVRFALAAYKNIPFEVEERMYEELPDMLGSVETTEEIIADIVSMFHLERYKVPEHPFVELEKSIGTEKFTEVMLSLLRAVAQGENSEVSDYIHDMGYKTPGTFINAIKRMSYLLPEGDFEDALKGTRYEIKPKKVKPEVPLVEPIYEAPPKVPPKYRREEIKVTALERTRYEEERRREHEAERTREEEAKRIEEIMTVFNTMFKGIVMGYGWNRGWSRDKIKDVIHAWEPALIEKAKEFVEGKIPLEEIERWMKEIVLEAPPKRPEEEEIPFYYQEPETRIRTARRILKTHWAEIVSFGLPAFFGKHAEYEIGYPTRGMVDDFAHMAFEMLSRKLRGTKHLSEWLLTERAPAAKVMIEYIFDTGLHDIAFQKWFIESHYPGDIEVAAQKAKPSITPTEFMNLFIETTQKISL